MWKVDASVDVFHTLLISLAYGVKKKLLQSLSFDRGMVSSGRKYYIKMSVPERKRKEKLRLYNVHHTILTDIREF